MKIFLHEAQPHQHTRGAVQETMVSVRPCFVCVFVWMEIFSLQLAMFRCSPEKSKRKLNEFDDYFFLLLIPTWLCAR